MRAVGGICRDLTSLTLEIGLAASVQLMTS
jgi:hypothetical protein